MNRIKAAVAILAGVVILGLLVWGYVLTGKLETARARADAAEAREIAFAERVKAKAEEIQRKALERARRIEADQDRISQEVAREYQARLDDARRRYDDLLRRPASGTNPGSGSGSRTPVAPAPGGTSRPAPQGGLSPGSAATWLTLEDALICTENSLRLVGWQDWWGRVSAVNREPDPSQSR
jgi:hypothetical protein